jgi:hypothetical protein
MYKKLLLVCLLFSPGALLAQEALSEAQLTELLSVKIRFANHVSYNKLIVRAVEAQNEQKLPLAEIKKRDKTWTDSSSVESQALIREITNNVVAKYFKRRVEGNSAISEFFLTDNQGANVAAYPPTGDYWQGDEGKWTSSFNSGDGVVFIGPLELDASTNTAQVQISSPVFSGGETIGVLVMGVSVDYISAQQ